VDFERWLHRGYQKRLACPICSGPSALRRAQCVRHLVTGVGQ
jgi:hypothetical protein